MVVVGGLIMSCCFQLIHGCRALFDLHFVSCALMYPKRSGWTATALVYARH